MMRLYNEVMEIFPKLAASRTVWTVGRMHIEPGAPAIIPGRAEMILGFRDTDPAVLERLDKEAHAIAARHNANGPCQVEAISGTPTNPAPMDERLQDAIEAAAEAHAPGAHMRMPSGAGHDAQILARRLPSAMMFVPSIGGVSHHFTENTADADIVLGAQVFADATVRILRGN
jgi:N-carbamoyl-L-amino-acid hydrolase